MSEELSAVVLAVLWRSPDRARAVARARTSLGELVVVTGDDSPESPLTESLPFRFVGTWDDHPRFGRQFRFDAAVLSSPVDRAGMIAYLTLLVDQVGQKRAEKLWDLYGERAAEILRNHPARIVADGVLGDEDAQDARECLLAHQGRERVLLELLTLLAGRGFGRKLPLEAIRLWGDQAASRIRRNPYLLMLRDLPGAGWKRCDKLWIDLGHSPTHPKRQVLAAVHYLREGHGDTWHLARDVARAIQELCGPTADLKRALRTAERWGKVAIRRKGTERHIALAEHARAEKEVTDCFGRLSAWTNPRHSPRTRARHFA